MAHVLRGLVQKLRYFKGSTIGLLTTFNGTQTQCHILSSVFPVCSALPQERIRSSSKYYTTTRGVTLFNHNVFRSVVGNILRNSNVTEAAVLNAVNKLITLYEAVEGNENSERQLRNFERSKEFCKFWTLLESQVHKFSLKALVVLFDLEYFNVPQTSSLMVKISKLVLDKFSTGGIYEKLLIYGSTLRKPCKEAMRNNIIKECEAYVKKSFVDDLNSKNSSSKLSLIFGIKGLPKHVKLILAEKLRDDILHGKIEKKVAVHCFLQILPESDDLLPREQWLDLIEFCLKLYSSIMLIKDICNVYLALVKKDTSYYSPELIQLLIDKMSCRGTALQFYLGEKLCEVGYFSEKLLHEVVSNFFSVIKASKGNSFIHMLSFLAQASVHEVVTESAAQQLRNVLENKEIFDFILRQENSSLLCMYLTYIGCDTRVLLSNIFKRADNSEDRDSNLLTLHHFAKAYFPGEYESLSEKTVNRLVKNEFKQSSLWDSEDSIGKCFESKHFILRNCTTSDRHCLYFVAVFQSNGKPVNLASYSKISGPENFFNVDTIEKPPGSKMISFILFPYKQPVKFLNLPSMTGSAKMYLKSFQDVSCDIVLLHKTFFSLSLEDKKKFLMSQIDEIFKNSGIIR